MPPIPPDGQPPAGSQPPNDPQIDLQQSSADSSSVETPPPDSTQTPLALNTIGSALEAFEQQKRGLGSPAVSQGQGQGQGQGQAATPQTPQTPKPRDFTGLADDEKHMFQRMSNDAYAKLYPFYLQAKKDKEELAALRTKAEQVQNTHFFEQEGAFKVMPEYQQLEQQYGRIEAEKTYWQDQLANIRAGNEWSPLVLDAEGKVVIGAPRPADPHSEALVINQLTQAHTLSQQFSGKLQAFQQNFGTQFNNYKQGFKQVEDRIFGDADREGKLTAAAKIKLEMFPSTVRGRIEVQALAKAMVVIDGMIAMIEQLKATTTTNGIKQRTAANAGPTNDSIISAPPGAGTVGSVLDEFKKARAAGLA